MKSIKPLKEVIKVAEKVAKVPNIFERMSAITDELKTVAKNLSVQVNKNASYKAVSERDILDAVKPLEKKHGIYSYPLDREIVEKELLEKESNGYIVTSRYLRIKTIYRFLNIDSPQEYIDMITYADGIDSGDKATGKAMTYADKYALMKAYKISTGDDPDQEASPEQGYKKQSEPQKKNEPRATEKQIAMITEHYTPERIEKMLAAYRASDLSQLTIKQASEAISKAMEEKANGNH